jgi:hypothetical protein
MKGDVLNVGGFPVNFLNDIYGVYEHGGSPSGF